MGCSLGRSITLRGGLALGLRLAAGLFGGFFNRPVAPCLGADFFLGLLAIQSFCAGRALGQDLGYDR